MNLGGRVIFLMEVPVNAMTRFRSTPSSYVMKVTVISISSDRAFLPNRLKYMRVPSGLQQLIMLEMSRNVCQLYGSSVMAVLLLTISYLWKLILIS